MTDGMSKDEILRDQTLYEETLKNETLKDETLKAEALKAEALKDEAREDETLKDETLKAEASKDETSREESLKAEISRGETLGAETSTDTASKQTRLSDKAGSAGCRKCLMILAFWAVILLPNFLFAVTKDRFQEDNLENRLLAEMPRFSLRPFEFHPDGIEDYINDHAAFRSQFLSLYATINMEWFDFIDSQSVLKGKDGWLFFADGESLPDYQRTNLFTQEELVNFAGKVNEAESYYAARGIEFVVLLAPSKEGIQSAHMPDGFVRMPGPSRLEQLAGYLREHTNVKIIFPQDEFQERAARGQELYYKTDTHWNAAGAFTASQQVIDALGGAAVSMDDLDVTYMDQAPGDLARLAHLPQKYAKDSSPVIGGYYDGTEVNCTYADQYRYKVENETPAAPDPRHLAVCRDSFAESMMPYFEKYFSKTSAYHYSVFDKSRIDQLDVDIMLYEVVERQLDRITDDIDRMIKDEPLSY